MKISPVFIFHLFIVQQKDGYQNELRKSFCPWGELGHIILVCLFYTDLILIEWLCR